MSEIKIDKNIEMPGRRGTRVSKYPWDKLAVGHSFAVPVADGKVVASLASAAGRRLKMKFNTRKMDKELRVWRTK